MGTETRDQGGACMPLPAPAGRRALLRALGAGLLAAPAGGCAYFDPSGTLQRNLSGVPQGSVPIFLVVGDWHLDIVVETRLIAPPLLDDFMPPPLDRRGHAAFGFGSRQIFENSKPDAGSFALAFMNTPGAMAVCHAPPRLSDMEYFEQSVELRLTPEGFDTLIGTLRAEIRDDAEGRPLRIGDGLFRRGRVLFETHRRYTPRYTCSTWAAELLAAAGLPFMVTDVVWPQQVMRQARRIARQQGLGAPEARTVSAG